MVSVALEELRTPEPSSELSVVPGPVTRARRDELVHNAHGELLAELVHDALREANAVPADLAAVGAGLGPGPFTGLRVGVVTAAAMGDALGVPVYGMCSLDTISDLDANDHDAAYAVVTDARRRQVYWAVYDARGNRIEGPDIAPPAEVAARLGGRVRRLIGPVASEHPEAFADFVVTGPRWPDAATIAADALVRASRSEPAVPLLPLYLRRPDARPPGPPKQVTPR